MTHFIFDIGGVLIDYSVDRLIRRVCEQTGVGFGKAAQELASADTREVESGRMDGREFFEQHIKVIVPHWTYQHWVAAWMENYSINEPGCRLFLELKTRGQPVYMLSNLAEYNKEAIERKFPALFRASRKNFFSFELGCLKPGAEIYQKTCAWIGAAPQQCVFLDDVQANVDGASSVGMTSLCFANERAEDIRAALAKFTS